MRMPIIMALVAVLVTSCRDAEEEVAKGFFITTIGEHEIVRKRASFTVFPAEDGKLNYRFFRKTKYGSTSGGPARARVEPDAPWFAYVETDRRIWVCDGQSRLDLLAYNEEMSATYSVTHPCTPQPPACLIKQIPEPVRGRLPQVILAQIDRPDRQRREQQRSSGQEGRHFPLIVLR